MMGNYKLGVAVLIGLVLAATGLWAAAADEEPAAAMEKEMVLDPTTGEMVSAPEYGGTITGLFHPGWETEHADMWHFRSVIHPTKLILERMGGGNWGLPRDEFTEATDARRSVIMENIFVLPGLGRVLLKALQDRDYPLVMGVNLCFGAVEMGVNLLIDLLYPYLDPASDTKKNELNMAKSANAQRHWLVDLLVRLVKTKPLGAAFGAVVLALILVSIFADVLAPYPYDEIRLMEILEAPSASAGL